MRTTVDIPDPIYRELKSAAASRGSSIKEIVLRGIKAELHRPNGRRKRKKTVRLPIFDSKKPGWLELDNRRINEILFP